jgi:hypothetical protein
MSTSGTNKKITKSNFLSGYETSEQLNTRDVNNRNRANHTGTQPLSSIIIPDNSISESKLLNYEDLTFTPTLLDSITGNPAPGVVYDEQIGHIFRRDSLILCSFWLKWTALTASENGVIIGGMPRALNVNGSLRFPLQIAYYNSLNLPNNTDLYGFIGDGTSFISLLYGNNTNVANTVTATDLSTSGELYASVLYPNGA